MPYQARVFRIAIASPSDVGVERDIAVAAISAWNDQHSAEFQTVLLPLRWETHAVPLYDARPQEVINRAVVDSSDILVGVFWTRVGSPTGKSDSGTLEEIERAAAQGKPVMLFFSEASARPDDIDISQLKDLREFKRRVMPNSLVEHFSNGAEFKDKLSRALHFRVKELNAIVEDGTGAATGTKIALAFAAADAQAAGGRNLNLVTRKYVVADEARIPDFETLRQPKGKAGLTALSGPLTDKNYFRDLVSWLKKRSLFRPISFWLANDGTIGARDLYIECRIVSTGGTAFQLQPIDAVTRPPQSGTLWWGGADAAAKTRLRQLSATDWRFELEIAALQPKRQIPLSSQIAIGVDKSCTLELSATIYADVLAEPVAILLMINIVVEEQEIGAFELLKTIEPRFSEVKDLLEAVSVEPVSGG